MHRLFGRHYDGGLKVPKNCFIVIDNDDVLLLASRLFMTLAES